MLDVREIFKKIAYGEVAIFTTMGTFLKYCMSYETDCLDPAFAKFYATASAVTKNDLKLIEIWNLSLKGGKLPL
jgi:hypothetical protein